MIVSGCIPRIVRGRGGWDDVARHWQDRGRAKVPGVQRAPPLARPREGIGTVTVLDGHGSKQDTFLFRAVFTELDRTKVFLIYTQLCMDLIMTTNGEIQY